MMAAAKAVEFELLLMNHVEAVGAEHLCFQRDDLIDPVSAH